MKRAPMFYRCAHHIVLPSLPGGHTTGRYTHPHIEYSDPLPSPLSLVVAKYPAFLPCFIMFLYTIVGITACTFFVKESNPHANSLPSYLKSVFPCFLRDQDFFERPPLEEGELYTDTEEDDHGEAESRAHTGAVVKADFVRNPNSSHRDEMTPDFEHSVAIPLAHEDRRRLDETTLEDAVAIAYRSTTGDGFAEKARPPTESTESVVVDSAHAKAATAPQTRFGYVQAFSLPVARFVLIMYMLVASADAVFGQIVPLWLSASQASGGLGFLPQQSSMILLCGSVPCIASNLVFPAMMARYRNKMGLFRVSVGIGAVTAAMVPMTSYFLPECVAEPLQP